MTDMSERSTATAVEGFSGGAERGTAAADRLDLDVMIVGAQKSGTSTLLRHLLCAPGVAPLHRPEIAYLTDDDEYERGGRVAVRKYFGSEAPPNALRVGKTAGMMTSPTAVRRLVSDSPRVRLVAVLRNPVHRAYSAYWFAKRRGFEPAESFSEAIDRELSGKSLQLPRQDLREYVLCGEYAVHLEQLHHEVDPRRVHVYLLKDLASRYPADRRRDPRAIWGRHSAFGAPTGACQHIGAGAIREVGAAHRIVLAPATDAPPGALARDSRPDHSRHGELQRSPLSAPPMEDDVRAKLAAYFEPHNRRLESLIERDLSAWDQP